MSHLLFGPLAPYYFQLEKRDQRLLSDVHSLDELIKKYYKPSEPQHNNQDQTGQTHWPILDLGCGTGEHALALSRYGYHLTGIDHAAAMLDVARTRAASLTRQASAGKDSDQQIQSEQSLHCNFLQADFRRLPLQSEIAAAYCLFGGFNYLTNLPDLKQALQSTYNALMPQGVLIIEFWQREPYDGLPYNFTTNWQELQTSTGHIKRRRSLQRSNDSQGQLLIIHYEYELQSISGVPDGAHQEEHRFRLLDRKSLIALGQQTGFHILEERSLLNAPGLRPNSGSLILILRKD